MINNESLRALARCQLSNEEICASLQINVSDLTDEDLLFIERARLEGRGLIKQQQFKQAITYNDKDMLLYISKVYLQQDGIAESELLKAEKKVKKLTNQELQNKVKLLLGNK